MRRSRCTYNCNHSSPAPAARTSSSSEVDAVDSTNGSPARCAARARCTSASGQNSPFRPVGPTIAGMAAAAPWTVVCSWQSVTSASTSGTNSSAPKAATLRRNEAPSSAPPSR